VVKSPEDQPGIAVIGCGGWGKNLVRNFFELGALVAVCDTDSEVANSFAKEFRAEAMSEDEIMADSRIDALVIANPAEHHVTLAMKAIEAGKHIYVEKPLALNVAQAQQISIYGKQMGKIVMVGHILQYHSAFIKLKEVVASGELGNLHHIYTHRLGLGRLRRHENVLWDLAPHDISMILALTGELPSKVTASGHTHLHDEIATTSLATLSFSNGLSAHMHTSWMSPFKEQKLVVVGDKGVLVFDDRKPWGEKLAIYRDCVIWEQGLPIENSHVHTEYIKVEESEPLKNECRHFLDSINYNKTPITDGDEGVQVTRVLEAAEKAMKSGQVIHLPIPKIEEVALSA
jgi:UDP-2-acetamido-3-amino-2,3-dideoxy-glucuronate N-acetyltransferase